MDISIPVDFAVHGDLHANDINVIQQIHIPEEPPPKNVRFNLEKPIVTFTGRKQFLLDLHKTIQESRGQIGQVITVLTQAPLPIIAATGGVGKTETVRMYIDQHGHEYDHVIWIDAEEPFVATRQFRRLAAELKIPRKFDGKAKPFELILKEVYEKLCQNAHSILLVFDNAESLDNDGGRNGIREFLPGVMSPFFVEPTVLVTSRSQNWRHQKLIQLDLWTDEECVTFVLTQLKLEYTEENEVIALELGERFGRLPIAMQSAVAVIIQDLEENSTGCNTIDVAKNLVKDYKAGQKTVLEKQPWNSAANITMISLWNVSLKKILKNSDGKLAVRILAAMSYLSSTGVPKIFLRSIFPEYAMNRSFFARALMLLRNYSLITMYEKHFTMHRMIQDVTIENLKSKIGAAAELIFSKSTFHDENEAQMFLIIQLIQYSAMMSEKEVISGRDNNTLASYIQLTHHLSDNLDFPPNLTFLASTATLLSEACEHDRAIDMFTKVLEVMNASKAYSFDYICNGTRR